MTEKKDSRLISVLKTFSIEELRHFRQFLQVDLYNTSDLLREYFSFLDAHVISPDTGAAALSDLDFQTEKSPNNNSGKFQQKNRIGQLNNRLLHLALRFLALARYTRSQVAGWPYMLAELRERKLSAVYHATINRIKKQADAEPDIPDAFYLRFLLASDQILDHLAGAPRQEKKEFPGAVDALDRFHLLERLRYACAHRNATTLRGEVQAPDTHMESLFVRLPNPQLVIVAYYQVYLTLAYPDVQAHFETLRDLLLHNPALPGEIRLEISQYALNYIVRRYNAGDKNFGPELTSLYNSLLASEVLLQDGKLPALHFKNITMQLAHTSQLEKLEAVIRDYGDRLTGDYHGNALTYAQAILAFENGAYDQAASLCWRLLSDHADIYYGLDARVLELKCSFELGEFDLLEARADAFRMYLVRNTFLKNADTTRENYQNFLKMTRQLARIVSGNPEELTTRLAQLRAEAEAHPQLPSRNWLIRKMA